MPRIMFVWIVPEKSGLRPMAWTAPPETTPMPMPPPMTPIIAMPAPINFPRIVAASTILPSMMVLPPLRVGLTLPRMLVGRLALTMPSRRQGHEDQGQHAEDVSLDQADEKLQHQ